MEKCLKLLHKALKNGLHIEKPLSDAGYIGFLKDQVQVVETYINISNAYNYFDKNMEALHYANEAVRHAAKYCDISYNCEAK
jgi:hypothetical protein